MYLGIDIGSVSIKYALVNPDFTINKHDYFRTHGDVINSLKKILTELKGIDIFGIGVTGSGRQFVKALINADLDIDEITAHRVAINKLYPNVKTIFEIGGQDSKLIYFGNNFVSFEMNNVCAAGTGSFLDQQANRFSLSIKDFYEKGLSATEGHRIASKCTVFAESDMIHAQQSGIPLNKVIRGLHQGLISNYFTQLGKGKKLTGEFLFEGGASENLLLVEELGNKLIAEGLIKNEEALLVPRPYNKVIGAIGAAIVCKNRGIKNMRIMPDIQEFKFLDQEECLQCPNKCRAKVIKIEINNKIITIGKTCQN